MVITFSNDRNLGQISPLSNFGFFYSLAMTELKLIAFDPEGLVTLSAHMQDAILRVGDIAYLPGEGRFVIIANRFNWHAALQPAGNGKKNVERRRTGLRFEHVKRVQRLKIKDDAPNAVLELLSIEFEESSAPEGIVTFNFSGGGAIRLEVECLEAELKDLGPAWSASSIPEHSDENDSREESDTSA